MTDNQRKRFFMPAFHEACERLGWREEKGRLIVAEDRLNRHGQKAFAAASARAAAQHRAPTMSDLRHGCIIAELGHDKDTLKLTSTEQNRLLDFLKLCADETDLGADVRRSNPIGYERDALIAKIKKLKIPEAMILAICRKYFEAQFRETFEGLPLQHLRSLCGILQETKARKAAAGENLFQPQMDADQRR